MAESDRSQSDVRVIPVDGDCMHVRMHPQTDAKVGACWFSRGCENAATIYHTPTTLVIDIHRSMDTNRIVLLPFYKHNFRWSKAS